jgi:hypothetical protein
MRCTSSFEDNITLVSLLLKSWSIHQICSEFEATAYPVHIRNIIQKGLSSSFINKKQTSKKKSNTIYEDDEHSIICLGMKDIICVQHSEGVRTHKSKLSLCELN